MIQLVENIISFFTSESGIGLLGVIIGAFITSLVSFLIQRSANNAAKDLAKLAILKDHQTAFFEDCWAMISELESDSSYILDRRLYCLAIKLCAQSKIFARNEIQEHLASLTKWIEKTQREFKHQEKEIHEKYFKWVCCGSSDNEAPIWVNQFVGRSIEEYEDELEKCEKENTPDKTMINSKLVGLIKLLRKEIFIDEFKS